MKNFFQFINESIKSDNVDYSKNVKLTNAALQDKNVLKFVANVISLYKLDCSVEEFIKQSVFSISDAKRQFKVKAKSKAGKAIEVTMIDSTQYEYTSASPSVPFGEYDTAKHTKGKLVNVTSSNYANEVNDGDTVLCGTTIAPQSQVTLATRLEPDLRTVVDKYADSKEKSVRITKNKYRNEPGRDDEVMDISIITAVVK
ncbi:hypothetical protein MA9V2_269 [Chryseobacterium phage MA9V-2]|nr:hypothetical protein MA9V2_269 [Chryseobacterium phage MA9V-2]